MSGRDARGPEEHDSAIILQGSFCERVLSAHAWTSVEQGMPQWPYSLNVNGDFISGVSPLVNWLEILITHGDWPQSTSTGTAHCCALWHVDETGGAVLEKPVVLHAAIRKPTRIVTTTEGNVTRRDRTNVSGRVGMLFSVG